MGTALTQDTYRLWCRIGYISGLTNSDAQVVAQLAAILAAQIANEVF
jgi:hypothetical protein